MFARLFEALKRALADERSFIGTLGPSTGSPDSLYHAGPARGSQVRLLREPQPAALDHVLTAPVSTLLVAGIVNPFGPTMTAVVVPGELGRAKYPVFRLMLNPFRQEAAVVGELSVGEEWLPWGIIPPLFDLDFGGCPSLLLPSSLIDQDLAVPLHAAFLQRFEDARPVLTGVSRYFGNPWERISQEIALGLEEAPGEPPTLLDDNEAEALAELLLDERHMTEELRAFSHAWDGAIANTPPGLATMSSEAFYAVYNRIANTCRRPGH